MIYSIDKSTTPYTSLNITPDQIAELSEFCFLNHRYLLESERSNPDRALRDFCDEWFINPPINDIFKSINTYGRQIAHIIKTKGINKDGIEDINVAMNQLFENLGKDMRLKDKAYMKFKNYDANKIKASMLLVLYVLMANTITTIILVALLGGAGDYLSIVITAPVIEESAKRIAITGGFGTEFSIVFNAFEFTQYFFNFKEKVGAELIAKIRGIVVVMHLCTAVIQYITSSSGLLKKLNLDKEKDKDKVSNMGYICGILIHSLWNAGLSTVVISSILGD